MKPILLGTAASEAIPAVFCECPVCSHVRKYNGKNVRTRSSFLIDEYNIIDFSPDVFHQVLNCGISLKKLRNILLTHFHEDHFNIMEMAARMCAIPRLEDMVMVICSAPAAEQIAILFERFKDHNQENPFNYFQKYQFATVEPFQTYHFHNLEETPILSSHHSYGIGWNRGNGT